MAWLYLLTKVYRVFMNVHKHLLVGEVDIFQLLYYVSIAYLYHTSCDMGVSIAFYYGGVVT